MAEQGLGRSQRATPRGDGRIPLDEVAQHWQRLLEAAHILGARSQPPQLRVLDRVEHRRDRLLGTLAAGERLPGQRLGVVESPVDQRPHPAQQRDVPQELRLAQLGGEALVSGEVGVDAADVADLEPVPESIDVSAHLELEIAAPLGEIVHLAALTHPALGLAR